MIASIASVVQKPVSLLVNLVQFMQQYLGVMQPLDALYNFQAAGSVLRFLQPL